MIAPYIQEASFPKEEPNFFIPLFVISIIIIGLFFLLSKKKKVETITIRIPDPPVSLQPVVLPPSGFDSRNLANDPELMALNRRRQFLFDQRKKK